MDYNPIDHLNALFSAPSTLSSVPQITTTLLTHRNALDQRISSRVSSQRTTDAASLARIQTAQSQLSTLFSKIESVQQRALDTESSITSMTSEIKRLDATKRNLTHSMTTLKRLQMLTSAYEQLRALKGGRQYKECAGLLAAVLQLMAHFKSYRSIGQIAELSKGVADLQRELLEQVCEDFELAFAKGEVGAKKGMLGEACLVVDALGEYARQRLVNWYCNTQLREYRMVFRGSEEAGNLDNIARRYSWFMRMLKTYDAEHQWLFPREWRVNEMLANAFCEGTREDYKGILQRSMRRTDGQPPDVNLLLSCLQETLEFEQSLEKRFASGEGRASMDSLSSTRPEKKQGFTQAISEAFEPYLSIWVESQDKSVSRSQQWIWLRIDIVQAIVFADTQVSSTAYSESRRRVSFADGHSFVDRAVQYIPRHAHTMCKAFYGFSTAGALKDLWQVSGSILPAGTVLFPGGTRWTGWSCH